MLLNFFKAAAKKWPLSERPMACPDLLSGKMSGSINRRIYVSYGADITSTVCTDGKIARFLQISNYWYLSPSSCVVR